jgi:hypothetical protein
MTNQTTNICAYKPCSKEFVPFPQEPPGPAQLYCSHRCHRLASNRRWQIKHREHYNELNRKYKAAARVAAKEASHGTK